LKSISINVLDNPGSDLPLQQRIPNVDPAMQVKSTSMLYYDFLTETVEINNPALKFIFQNPF